MQMSHSRVETFVKCPYKYKLRYLDKLTTLPDDKPDNALYLGTALHTAIQVGVPEAIQEYYSNYPVINDEIVNEAIKLEIMGEKARQAVPHDGQAEILIEDEDFKGFIDWLVPAKTEEKLGGEHQVIPYQFDLYDFKYSNNERNYMDSDQLHLYKYYFEKTHPGQYIRDMYFLFVPKSKLKRGQDETLEGFRKRIIDDCRDLQPHLMKVEYQPEKVIRFLTEVKQCIECETYNKNQNFLCKWCEYQPFCMEGKDYIMNLPSSERRTVTEVEKTKTWIYGAPFSGKTTMLDDAPNPLNLNTDGNIQFVTMPYVGIKDEVTTTGRMTNRKFAWEVFKEAIAELEKKQNDFETIILDLVEDTREMCRLFKYDEMGISHESDSGYGKGWDIIKTEYLSVIKRFFNLPYKHLVVVSHQIEGEVKRGNGSTITTFKPNLQDAIANKIAGMVDIVGRVIVKDDGTRTLNFKSNEYIFGGGRLKDIQQTEIPLSWDALMDVYNSTLPSASKREEAPKKEEPKQEAPEPVEEEPMMGVDEEPPKRTRRRSSEPVQEEPAEQPTTTRRRRTRA